MWLSVKISGAINLFTVVAGEMSDGNVVICSSIKNSQSYAVVYNEVSKDVSVPQKTE
jgi:hypothetical protein